MWALFLVLLFTFDVAICYTDRLIVKNPKHCQTSTALVDAAHKACGQVIAEFSFGRSCGNGTFAEISFVCNSLQTDHIVVPIDYFNEFYRGLQIYALKLFRNVAVVGSFQSDSTLADLPSNYPVYYLLEGPLPRQNNLVIFQVVDMMMRQCVLYEQFVLRPVFREHPENSLFVSVAQLRASMRERLVNDETRMKALIATIKQVLEEDFTQSNHNLQKFNVENFFKESEFGFAKELYFRHPALQKEFEAIYVDHCRNHTFGIDRRYLDYLSENDAHIKLIAQYTEMFTPGRRAYFKYMDASAEDRIAPEQSNNSWSDRLIAEKSCLSPEIFAELANKLCQKEPINRMINITNTVLLYPDAIHLDLRGPCDAENRSFREMTLTCHFPQHIVEMPPRGIGEKLFHRSYLTMLQQYAKILKDGSQKLVEGTDLYPLFDVEANGLYTYLTLEYGGNENFTTKAAIVGSRKVAFTWTAGSLINIKVPQRTKILFHWATQLIRNETFNVDEMKEFNVENIIALYQNDAAFIDPYSDREELRRRVAEYYVEYCKQHTVGVDRKHLNFLNAANGHVQLAALYKKIYSYQTVDVSYSTIRAH